MAMWAGGACGVMTLIGGACYCASSEQRTLAFHLKLRDIMIIALLVIQCALGLGTIRSPRSTWRQRNDENWWLAQSVLPSTAVQPTSLRCGVYFSLHLVLGMTFIPAFPFLSASAYLGAPVEYLTRRYQLVRNRR